MLYYLFFGTFLLFLAIYGYFQYVYNYWKRREVPYLEPKFPLGNSKYLFADTPSHTITTAQWYKTLKARGEKFGGVWDLCRPILVLVDPDYIRDILIKDFSHFIDRDFYQNGKANPQRNHLFVVKSDKWKNMRQKLTPTFTSGKMKMMFDGVVDCSKIMVDYLSDQVEKGQDIDIKQVLASFTIDVIGCCAFGINSNSFKNPTDEFRSMGYKLFQNDTFTEFVNIPIIRALPNLGQMLGIKISNEEVTLFFNNLVKNTIKYRTENNITRPDFLQLLIKLREDTRDNECPFNTDAVIANTVLFFVAGFDTSSTTMNFALYELARNPDVQEKARQEILNILEKHNNKLTYESLSEMVYLRQVIDETLRLYPSVQTLARICTRNYQLRDTNITLEKGTSVVISPLGLGRDPEHFPEPEKFDPERFNAENKMNRHPYVHIPFGEGPRNCIGLRFGLMQSSIGLIQILKNFTLSVSPKTEMPLTLHDKSFLLKSNETLYLKMEKL